MYWRNGIQEMPCMQRNWQVIKKKKDFYIHTAQTGGVVKGVAVVRARVSLRSFV
jgi:hypothetical protein